MNFEKEKEFLEKFVPVKTQELFLLLCLMKIAVYRSHIQTATKIEKDLNDKFALVCANLLSATFFSTLQRTHGDFFKENADVFTDMFTACEHSTFNYALDILKTNLKKDGLLNQNLLDEITKIFGEGYSPNDDKSSQNNESTTEDYIIDDFIKSAKLFDTES